VKDPSFLRRTNKTGGRAADAAAGYFPQPIKDPSFLRRTNKTGGHAADAAAGYFDIEEKSRKEERKKRTETNS
jgi:hypothetical protein